MSDKDEWRFDGEILVKDDEIIFPKISTGAHLHRLCFADGRYYIEDRAELNKLFGSSEISHEELQQKAFLLSLINQYPPVRIESIIGIDLSSITKRTAVKWKVISEMSSNGHRVLNHESQVMR